ncbi:phosphoserine phosphatase SerB [Silvibacterium dinghuense]|uniref:Phosphoserine phosphatase n=1 Tax=Silvibacterium dinghuense TaxID=1560006 RepID=A0A4Q1SJL7_9BACT|nr:phosphoserine phosphatase SerB [Silvibacterium dinghuense]RXS97633.1 phosphoserine phosphatase SerB [Silvibacterium dinghuense]GGH00717.1 phosphoserine phosphatase SerB [Silvibacterium dinghuense]
MSQTVLLHFSGQDHPGLTTALTGILADFDACILDVGQAVVHETLALGLLIELPVGAEFAPLKTALETRSESLGLRVRFTPISAEALSHWLSLQGKDRFILTVLGRSVTAAQLSAVTGVIAAQGLNIDRIERLSGRLSLAVHTPHANACVEIQASGAPRSQDEMKAGLLEVAQRFPIDVAFQRESIFRRNRRLFAFDMDSTLIQGEVIDELAKLAGVADQVVKITESAMRGEIEFQESFRRRVGLLKGLPEARVRELLGKIPLTEGAEQLICTLKTLGYKTAILSGGFTFFAHHLQQRFGIDYVYANELEMANGAVTGEVTGAIVDGARKAEALREIAERENISLEQVIAVGDGANDLPMLKLAGMGIAFRAKPLVRASASHSLTHLGLDSLLYLIGVRDRDTEKLACFQPVEVP